MGKLKRALGLTALAVAVGAVVKKVVGETSPPKSEEKPKKKSKSAKRKK